MPDESNGSSVSRGILLTLLITGLGVAGPIVWDFWKSQTEIQLAHLSTATIVEQVEELEKLELVWAGQPIPRVTQLEFRLENTGNQVIHKDEIISYPTLAFSSESRILQAEVTSRTPENLKLEARTDTVLNEIRLLFPLLNPDEQAQFRVLLTGDDPAFSASTRISGISQISIVDESSGSETEQDQPERSVPITAWIAMPFTVTALLFGLFGLYQTGRESEAHRLWSSDLIELPDGKTVEEYQSYLKRLFGDNLKTDNEVAPLADALGSLPDDATLSDRQYNQLTSMTEDIVANNEPVIATVVVFFVVAGAGMVYLLSVFV